MTNSNRYDVVIVGAGPSGIICALQLAKKNYRIALIEKATYPRDKTCGDAISLDVHNQFKLIDDDLALRFEQFTDKMPTHGVKIIAPSFESFDIPSTYKGVAREAYVCKRIDFDNFLFKELKQFENIHVFENSKVTTLQRVTNHVEVSFAKGTEQITLQGKMLIGADGAHSIVAKTLSDNKVDYNYYSAGLRVYYENVTGFNEGNYIELHFLKDILPGYLWVFPLPNNQANVGIGLLSKQVAKKKINLKKVLNEALENHPQLKVRFKEAKALETIKGFGLPLGNPKRSISGERYILLGDAAGLIDPFSGEGIGNAIRSGRVAAMHFEACMQLNDFSKQQNKAYDIEIYKRMGKEFTVSKTLQYLCRFPKLFNYVVKKANNNAELKQFLLGTVEDVEKKKMLTKPSFYYRLFFKS